MPSSLPSSAESTRGTRNWPHAPPHRLAEAGVYFLTARTRNQFPVLASDQHKNCFQQTLHELAQDFGWTLEAWAILANHYHLVAHSPGAADDAASLAPFVQKLHSLTTKEFNRLHPGQPPRKRLWQNYRETHLTHQKSYLARLNYVHQNAVHHGLVAQASDYKWCSAASFNRAVTPAWRKTITSFNYDQIAHQDGE